MMKNDSKIFTERNLMDYFCAEDEEKVIKYNNEGKLKISGCPAIMSRLLLPQFYIKANKDKCS